MLKSIACVFSEIGISNCFSRAIIYVHRNEVWARVLIAVTIFNWNLTQPNVFMNLVGYEEYDGNNIIFKIPVEIAADCCVYYHKRFGTPTHFKFGMQVHHKHVYRVYMQFFVLWKDYEYYREAKFWGYVWQFGGSKNVWRLQATWLSLGMYCNGNSG
jgi:hypothetical protein